MYDIDKLNRILLALLGKEEYVNQWWSSKNKAFDMRTPLDVYIDDPYKVSKYIIDQIDPGGS